MDSRGRLSLQGAWWFFDNTASPFFASSSSEAKDLEERRKEIALLRSKYERTVTTIKNKTQKRKENPMKKTILLLLTLTLILGVFASCQKRYLHIDDETSSSPSKETTTEREETTEDEDSDITIETTAEENEDITDITTEDVNDTLDITVDTTDSGYVSSYTIEEIDGQHYMVFNSYTVDPVYIYTPHFLEFLTPEELLTNLSNKTLDINAMNFIVRHFDKTENGIPIFDLDNFYVPSMPLPWTLNQSYDWIRIIWSNGQEYEIGGVNKADGRLLAVKVLNKEAFDYELHDMISKIDSMAASRMIENGQKKISAFLELTSSGGGGVHMYVEEGDLYYIYLIGGTTEMPDDEYMLSFGLQKYKR